MSDTEELATNEEAAIDEVVEEQETESPQSLRDELALQLEVMESDDEDDIDEDEDVDEEDEESEDEEQDDAEDTELGIEPELMSTFKYMKKEDREALMEKEYPSELLNMFLKDMQEKTVAYQEKSKDHADLVKTIEPFEHAFAMQGMSVADKFRQYIAIEQDVSSDPVGALLRLGQSYGVDLREALKQEQSSSSDEWIDPVSKEVSELRAKLERYENQQKEGQQQTMQAEVESFQGAKGEDGQLLHPHFEKVRPLMAMKFKSGQADNLEQAYNLVVNDLGLSNKSVQPTQERKPKKSVKQAKRLASGVSSKSTSQKTAIEASSRQDEMKEIWKSLEGGKRNIA